MAAKLIPDSVRDVLSYDPETGVFTWIDNYHKSKIGTVAGSLQKSLGYIKIGINGTYFSAHRLAWFFVHGEQPYIIDHINHDRADNRIANLRNVDYVLNGLNQRRSVGVHWSKVGNQVFATYRTKVVYAGYNILLAWHARIMAERADHPIGLPTRPSSGR